LTDEEAIVVLLVLCKSVNVVDGGVCSVSDSFFHVITKVITLNKFLIRKDLLNSAWQSFMEEDSFLSFN